MRITQGMLNSQMINDIQNNYQQLSQLQNEIATGHQINTPADSPVGVGMVMQYNSQLASYQQYQANATSAQGWLQNASSVMNEAQQIMQQARTLAVQGANDTETQSDRQDIATQVQELYQELVTTGNSQYNGQYIFNGQDVTNAPYTNADAASVNPNTGGVLYDVGTGSPLQVNTSGQDFFGSSADADNAFSILQNLQNALNNNDQSGIEQAITQIDSRSSAMEAAQTDVATRQDRIQFATSRLSDLTNNVTTLLSNVQDANLAQVITNYESAQNVQTASLEVGAQVLVPTLADFLK